MDNVMSQENTFSYKYSAVENKEIQEIRKRYLPQSESKLEELKRLDLQVQNSGMVESLCTGIISSLVFGLGILIGLIGMAGMIAAYPVFRAKQRKTKENLSPRILELAEELYQE